MRISAQGDPCTITIERGSVSIVKRERAEAGKPAGVSMQMFAVSAIATVELTEPSFLRQGRLRLTFSAPPLQGRAETTHFGRNRLPEFRALAAALRHALGDQA